MNKYYTAVESVQERVMKCFDLFYQRYDNVIDAKQVKRPNIRKENLIGLV